MDEMNLSGGLSIGIDIGGTNTTLGLVNGQGEILHRHGFPTTDHTGMSSFLTAINNGIDELLRDVDRSAVEGIGVGAPNADAESGVLMNPPNLPWKGITPLRQFLQDTSGFNTVIANDANAAAVGEMTYGAARGMKDFIVVTLGTGVGSGLVANGQIISGYNGVAGELGHVTAVKKGRRCNCGKHGCLETYASANGFMTTVRALLADAGRPVSRLDGYSKLSAEEVFKEALLGDQLARAAFNDTGRLLGEVLADVVTLLAPQAIILFGGLAQAGDLLLHPANEALSQHRFPAYEHSTTIVRSGLPGADAAILGACALYRHFSRRSYAAAGYKGGARC